MKVVSAACFTIAAAFATSCTAPQESGEPQSSVESSEVASPACNGITATPWNPATTNYWHGNALNMHLVMTDGGGTAAPAAHFYAWLISNGNTVAWLYKVPRADKFRFLDRLNQSWDRAQNTEPDRSIGSQGVGPGHPPSPQPGTDDFLPSQVSSVLARAQSSYDGSIGLYGIQSKP
jgi:hypothetical protein